MRRFTVRLTKKRKRRVGRPRIITIKRLLGSGINRPYKYKNRLMLGSGKKTRTQRGGFLPIGPIIGAAPAIIDILQKFVK